MPTTASNQRSFIIISRTVMVTVMLSFFAAGCEKSNDIPEVQSIDFGSGGGITGKFTRFSLDAQGQISQGKEENAIVIKLIDPLKARWYLDYAGSFLDYNYNVPDNMSEYLIIRTADVEHELLWGGTSAEIDPRVEALYDSLVSLMNK